MNNTQHIDSYIAKIPVISQLQLTPEAKNAVRLVLAQLIQNSPTDINIRAEADQFIFDSKLSWHLTILSYISGMLIKGNTDY